MISVVRSHHTFRIMYRQHPNGAPYSSGVGVADPSPYRLFASDQVSSLQSAGRPVEVCSAVSGEKLLPREVWVSVRLRCDLFFVHFERHFTYLIAVPRVLDIQSPFLIISTSHFTVILRLGTPPPSIYFRRLVIFALVPLGTVSSRMTEY